LTKPKPKQSDITAEVEKIIGGSSEEQGKKRKPEEDSQKPRKKRKVDGNASNQGKTKPLSEKSKLKLLLQTHSHSSLEQLKKLVESKDLSPEQYMQIRCQRALLSSPFQQKNPTNNLVSDLPFVLPSSEPAVFPLSKFH